MNMLGKKYNSYQNRNKKRKEGNKNENSYCYGRT